CEFGFIFKAEGDFFLCHFMINLLFETYLFQIQDNFNHVFCHTFEGSKFMVSSFDFYADDRISLQGVEQYPAQGIPDGYTVTWFQRTEFELGFKISCFLKYDFVWFLEI